MSETLETYETGQPWVVYTYFRSDAWTRIHGKTEIRCECCICGVRETLSIPMPRFGPVPIPEGGRHPERVRFLAAHEHQLQRTAPETWALPLRNPDAHKDTLEILRDVAEKARRSTSREPNT